MLRNRDDLLLSIIAKLDALDDDALGSELARLVGVSAVTPVYPFLIRTPRTTARTLAAFIEAAFLPSNLVATRH